MACLLHLHKRQGAHRFGSARSLAINYPFLLFSCGPLTLSIPGQGIHPALISHPIADEVLGAGINHYPDAGLQHGGNGRVKVFHPVAEHVKVHRC